MKSRDTLAVAAERALRQHYLTPCARCGRRGLGCCCPADAQGDTTNLVPVVGEDVGTLAMPLADDLAHTGDQTEFASVVEQRLALRAGADDWFIHQLFEALREAEQFTRVGATQGPSVEGWMAMRARMRAVGVIS